MGPACHVHVWKGCPCAAGAGSLSPRSFSPAGSHSLYLQEALRANTCRVVSVNLQLRASSQPPCSVCDCPRSAQSKWHTVSLVRPVTWQLRPEENWLLRLPCVLALSLQAQVKHGQGAQFLPELPAQLGFCRRLRTPAAEQCLGPERRKG